MKTRILSLALLLVSVSSLRAAEVAVGATFEEVRAALGAPRGQVALASRQLLYFERGEVEMQQGRVTRVALRTPEEHAAFQQREEQFRAQREARRAEWMAAGIAERDQKLADETFRDAPLAYQVSYWQDFARRYPGVPVSEPLAISRMKYNEQLQQQRRQEEQAERLADIEERLDAVTERSEFYPLYTTAYPGYYHRRPYYPPSLGPIEYTFFSSPLPPYTTPSGNPAGNLSGPVVNLPAYNPSQPTDNSDFKHRKNHDRDHDQRHPRDWHGKDRDDHNHKHPGRNDRRDRDDSDDRY